MVFIRTTIELLHELVIHFTGITLLISQQQINSVEELNFLDLFLIIN